MTTFDEMLQDLVNEDYQSLVNIASNAARELIPVLKQYDSENDGALLLSVITATALAADGQLTPLEKQLMADAFGLSSEAIGGITSFYTGDMDEITDNFIDSLNSDQKAKAVLLFAAICAVDETIKRDEVAFIARLLD